MDKLNLDKHISGQFNAEINFVRNQIMVMGGLVEQQLRDVIKAMATHDVELAQQVARRDNKVNSLEVKIDEECTRIIAKRQPAASDLRLIMAIVKTIADLERIGDVAKNVARMVENGLGKRSNISVASLETLGEHSVKMLHDVLDSFARMDDEAAFVVHREDEKLDKEYERLFRELMTYMMEDPRSIPNVLDALNAARCFERVGDRCQNIAEYVIYFVRGKDVRHLGTDEIAELL
ncbi:phosphate transport system regulator PhoU [Alginatibacterium sediminis]|uniref:Phosphate-specific transport system accessory protein PhoU n=1 Tax=Alginatibacterium sediminis TaxID=2164068 RepID=A0A420E9U0_9ALTE|nr:phosphate signaling complex protein PhoU [Alginatibacterium sediminis]RKF17446.1 phosphate transport system regulator PhoU [Alginatibacterium sediminis]